MSKYMCLICGPSIIPARVKAPEKPMLLPFPSFDCCLAQCFLSTAPSASLLLQPLGCLYPSFLPN